MPNPHPYIQFPLPNPIAAPPNSVPAQPNAIAIALYPYLVPVQPYAIAGQSNAIVMPLYSVPAQPYVIPGPSNASDEPQTTSAPVALFSDAAPRESVPVSSGSVGTDTTDLPNSASDSSKTGGAPLKLSTAQPNSVDDPEFKDNDKHMQTDDGDSKTKQ